MFKQKQALAEHLKRIKNRPLFALSYIICGALMGYQMWLFLWAPNNGSSLSVSFGYLLLPIVMVAAGRIIFKERISTLKFIAVLIAAIMRSFLSKRHQDRYFLRLFVSRNRWCNPHR